MPRLPPVEKFCHTRLRATFCPGVGYSVDTFDQSHSSSSATSCARPVSVPWPISLRATRITTVSSGRITTQALISPAAPCAAAVLTSGESGMWKPTTSAPAVAADEPRKRRRETEAVVLIVLSPSGLAGLGRHMDCGAHAVVGAATADVGHRVVDVTVARLRFLLQQRGRCHQHARLAEAALRHVELDPRLLQRMRRVGCEPFDRHDLLRRAHRRHRPHARAHRLAIDVHGAGAALRDATAVLGAGERELLAQHPQQRRVGLGVEIAILAIDVQARHHRLLGFRSPRIVVPAERRLNRTDIAPSLAARACAAPKHNARMQVRTYLKLSVAVALVTMALKFGAWWLTGSVGLLSDALESLVNLAGAAFAWLMVTVAAAPPDQDHP